MRENHLVVEREQLHQASFQAWQVMGDETATDTARTEAAQLFDRLRDIMLYQDGEGIRLIPMAFRVRGYYQDRVGEVLLDIPSEVVEAEPIRVAMLLQMAEFVDDTSYSTDARLDGLDALQRVLASLQAAAQETDEDEDEDEDEDTFQRGNNERKHTS